MSLKESIHPQIASLVTGHSQEGPAYAFWRAQGTDDWLLIAILSGGGQFGRFTRATGLSPRDYRKASVSPAASPETGSYTAPDGAAEHSPS